MLNRQIFYPIIFRKIYGKYSGEIYMQKRIESALPEHTFQLMKEASAMSGQTVKNFIAAAVTEKLFLFWKDLKMYLLRRCLFRSKSKKNSQSNYGS